MARRDLLEKAKRRLELLGPGRLRLAEEFLAYLEEQESEEATDEILELPEIVPALEEAERQIEQGRVTPAEQLGRKA